MVDATEGTRQTETVALLATQTRVTPEHADGRPSIARSTHCVRRPAHLPWGEGWESVGKVALPPLTQQQAAVGVRRQQV